jgi:hypothetical protein
MLFTHAHTHTYTRFGVGVDYNMIYIIVALMAPLYMMPVERNGMLR